MTHSRNASFGSLLIAIVAATALFLVVVIGPAAVENYPLWLVYASAAFGCGTVALVAIGVIAIGRYLAAHRRLPFAAVPLAVSLALCIVPAFVVFETGSYSPLTPAGPAASCLAWRYPLNPISGWSAPTALCVSMALPLLDADAVAVVAHVDLTDGLSTPVYTIALGSCMLLVGVGTVAAYRSRIRR